MSVKQGVQERYADEHAGFTLIEVMVSVMIISMVIASLLQLFATNTRLFATLGPKIDLSTQGSLLLGVDNIGFEKQDIRLDELVKEFRVDDDLNRRLHDIKAEVTYQELSIIDSADIMEEVQDRAEEDNRTLTQTTSDAVELEIGRTGLLIGEIQASFIRLRIP